MAQPNQIVLQQIPTYKVAVTPHDTTELADGCIGLYVGTGGNINCKLVGDTAASILYNVASGSVLYGRFQLVLSTSTTASNMLALY